MRRVFVIINPVSGPARRGSPTWRSGLATRALENLGAQADIHLTESAGHAYALAQDAAASGVEIVLAWGGDGTINEVGRALARRSGEPTPAQPRPALGIIPGGSGNGLARELRIPFDPARAIERALLGRTRHIDAGELGGRMFFNVAGIGLDAHVAALVSTRVTHRGLVPYLTAVARDVFRYEPIEYTVTVDGRTVQRPALFVAVANSRQYGFGARVAPAARLDDGLLDVVLVEDRGIAGNIVRIPSFFLGRLDRRSGVMASRLVEGTIRSRGAMLFHVDGEPVQGADTLDVRVHPGALRLRA